jgi:hypothetical protein
MRLCLPASLLNNTANDSIINQVEPLALLSAFTAASTAVAALSL